MHTANVHVAAASGPQSGAIPLQPAIERERRRREAAAVLADAFPVPPVTRSRWRVSRGRNGDDGNPLLLMGDLLIEAPAAQAADRMLVYLQALRDTRWTEPVGDWRHLALAEAKADSMQDYARECALVDAVRLALYIDALECELACKRSSLAAARRELGRAA